MDDLRPHGAPAGTFPLTSGECGRVLPAAPGAQSSSPASIYRDARFQRKTHYAERATWPPLRVSGGLLTLREVDSNGVSLREEETLKPLGEPWRRGDEMPCSGRDQALRVESDGQGIADALDPRRVIA
jgi:hypothetical protein